MKCLCILLRVNFRVNDLFLPLFFSLELILFTETFDIPLDIEERILQVDSKYKQNFVFLQKILIEIPDFKSFDHLYTFEKVNT